MLVRGKTQLGGHDDGGRAAVADHRADLTRNYLAIAARYLALHHHHRRRTLVGSSLLQLAVSTAMDFAPMLLPGVRVRQTRLVPLVTDARKDSPFGNRDQIGSMLLGLVALCL